MDNVSVRLSYHHLNHVLNCMLPKWRVKLTPGQFLPSGFPVRNETDTEDTVVVMTGSLMDGLAIPQYNDRNTQAQNMKLQPDLDFMIAGICNIGSGEKTNDQFILETSETEPGYVRLQAIPGRFDLLNSDPSLFKSVPHGTTGRTLIYYTFYDKKCDTLRELICELSSTRTGAIHGPALSIDGPWFKNFTGENRSNFNCDGTFSLRVTEWPPPATEWLHRERHYGWPSEKLIEDILQTGCHLVSKAHPRSSSPEIEWCFSFSVAEMALAKSFTVQQRQCYILLKTIISHQLQPNSVLSSYCLKNVFFWKLEQIPKDVIENSFTGVACGFLAVLDELISRMAEHNIPHYFVRHNNLLDGKPKGAVRSALNELIKIKKYPVEIILKFDISQKLLHSCSEPLSNVLSEFLAGGKTNKNFGEFFNDLKYSYAVILHFLAMYRISIDFSGALQEGVQICRGLADYVVHLANDLASTYADDVPFTSYEIRLAIGFAWCGFVHFTHADNDDDWDYNRLSIDSLFDLSIKSSVGTPYYMEAVVRNAMYLQFNKAFGSSIELLQQAGTVAQGLACDAVITFELFDATVLDSVMQTELQKRNPVVISGNTLYYHLLIQGHIQTNELTRANEITQQFRGYSRKLEGSSSEYMQWVCVAAYSLLAFDCECLNHVDDASNVLTAQQDLVNRIQSEKSPKS